MQSYDGIKRPITMKKNLQTTFIVAFSELFFSIFSSLEAIIVKQIISFE